MQVKPLAVVVGPLLVLAMLRRRWAFLFVLGSIPFFASVVFVGFSHPFRVSELALLVLGGHYLVRWLKGEPISLRNGTPMVLLWAFLGVGAVSILLVLVHPTTALVHPYGGTFLSRRFVPLTVSSHVITQMFLRVFFVGSVTVVVLSLNERRSLVVFRSLAYGAVLVAVVGLLYQLSVILGADTLLRIARSLELGRFPSDPATLGPFPRMYSIAGEPGFTVDYILYAFALTTVLWVVPGSGVAFGQRELRGLVLFLGGVLVISGATTGYGGLVILVVVFGALLALVPTIRPDRFGRVVPTVGVAALAVTVGTAVVTESALIDVVSRQIQKMLFQAGSGSIRMFYIRRSLEVFVTRPLFGAGIGIHHAPSYFATLLAETGIAGATTLVGAHLWVHWQCLGLVRVSSPPVRRLAVALGVAGFTLLMTNLVAKSIASLLLSWYILALALPISFVAQYGHLDVEHSVSTVSDNDQSRLATTTEDE